jgi:hypothetical protein
MNMVLTTRALAPGHSRREPTLAQGLVEKAFPAGLVACTKRVEFQKADYDRTPADDGFAMKRGIFTGSLAEHELKSTRARQAFHTRNRGGGRQAGVAVAAGSCDA